MDHERSQSLGGNTASNNEAIDMLLSSSLMNQTEVIGTREGGIVDCWVPTELIDHEEVPVKEEWARSLAMEMREKARENGGTGQVVPVALGLIELEESLKIMDGFHRDAALRMNREGKIYAAVESTDWNGLYDFRIFTAKDHAHIRFSRVVRWMREVWAHSNLDDKMSLETAIMLYRFDTSGAKLGLETGDVTAAKTWVARKEERWGMAAMTIHSHLKVAEKVDPTLVNAAREKKKSDKLEAPTQAILMVFANEIPDAFGLQNLVMKHATAHNLTGPEVKTLCKRVVSCTTNEATAVLGGIDWNDLKPTHGKSQQTVLRRAHDARHKGAKVFAQSSWEIQNVLRRAELSITRNEEIDDEMADKIKEAIKRADSLQGELGRTSLALINLLGPKDQRTIVTPNVFTNGDPTNEAKPQQPATEIEETDGPRQDIIGFLTGEAKLGSVSPFSQKDLSRCFSAIEKREKQPEGWRGRFIEIQNVNNKR